jgi:hypothetical protein
MPQINWVSKGRPIEGVFKKWLIQNPVIVIPNFNDSIFPPIRFSTKKALITICWEKNTFLNNVNRFTFPDVKYVHNVGHTKLLTQYSHMPIYNFPESSYVRNNQVHWKDNEWVNEEWLKSQFNEFFALFQKHQNELRKELR